MRNLKHIFLFALLMILPMTQTTSAANTLPPLIQTAVKEPLSKVGSGVYRKFGLRIYDATLWAPNGAWSADKAYALELHYARSLSKETVVGNVSDNISDEGVANEETLARWTKTLNDTLPAIEDGDTLIGLYIPGKKSQLFYNGKKIASLEDDAFSKAFFDIWLGQKADSSLRSQLLNIQE
jgi:Chalcone isomerase-like